ncbi:ERV/ALR sulfhydryl oxidase domain-containing protein [Crepidotus variabilis]|uniref:Sulfhydryl oxidase n=1 Tax=Crepidotus variabilis TaxID=179855 RepID=A0A9P6JTM4_9AGAR|nr:ERV/ALR sulfhydryl oxidase domain-containing protein [Crepidotus variabilis]
MPGDTPTSSQEKPNAKIQSKLPPGMVMGPDGKPCKICTAFRNWGPGTTNHTEPDSNRDKGASRAPKASAKPSEKQKQKTDAKGVFFPGMAGVIATGTAASASNAGEKVDSSSASRPDEPPAGCPPDVEQLGRATWMFLHTTAAYYPEKPTPTQRANMLMLLRSLPILYPCGWCAEDFGKDLQSNPPQVGGREALSRWLCERHNEVNQKLGKESFDCAKVDERWKDGPSDGRCD